MPVVDELRADAGAGAGAAPGVRMDVFTTGTVSVGRQWITNNVFGDRVHVPVPWFLIHHPRGLVLIDGGCPAAAGLDDTAHWGAAVTEIFGMRCHMEPHEACLPTLEAQGVDPNEVRWILQTHLHSDHMGAIHSIASFPNAQVLTTRREWDYSRAPDDFAAGAYVRKDLDQDIRWVLLEDGEDGYDLYGDGVIRAYHSPGHSVGHLSFVVTLPESGAILVTGDACDTADHWNGLALPGFAVSNLDAWRSVLRLRRIAERLDATVIFGHDAEQWPQFAGEHGRLT